jgi:hypothetical protein
VDGDWEGQSRCLLTSCPEQVSLRCAQEDTWQEEVESTALLFCSLVDRSVTASDFTSFSAAALVKDMAADPSDEESIAILAAMTTHCKAQFQSLLTRQSDKDGTSTDDDTTAGACTASLGVGAISQHRTQRRCSSAHLQDWSLRFSA